MLDNKDFEIIVAELRMSDNQDKVKNIIKKLELLIKANNIKEQSEIEMMNIQDELRTIYDEEHEVK